MKYLFIIIFIVGCTNQPQKKLYQYKILKDELSFNGYEPKVQQDTLTAFNDTDAMKSLLIRVKAIEQTLNLLKDQNTGKGSVHKFQLIDDQNLIVHLSENKLDSLVRSMYNIITDSTLRKYQAF